MVPRNNTHLYNYNFDRAIPTVINLWNILLNCCLIQLLPQSSNLLSFTAGSLSGVMEWWGRRDMLAALGWATGTPWASVELIAGLTYRKQPFTSSHKLRLIWSNQFTHHCPEPVQTNGKYANSMQKPPLPRGRGVKSVIVLTTQPLSNQGFLNSLQEGKMKKMSLIAIETLMCLFPFGRICNVWIIKCLDSCCSGL